MTYLGWTSVFNCMSRLAYWRRSCTYFYDAHDVLVHLINTNDEAQPYSIPFGMSYAFRIFEEDGRIERVLKTSVGYLMISAVQLRSKSNFGPSHEHQSPQLRTRMEWRPCRHPEPGIDGGARWKRSSFRWDHLRPFLLVVLISSR